MRINISEYKEHYHDKKSGKLIDNWQEGIRILPFTSNPTSAIDKSGGIAGATGLFFRLFEDDDVNAIEDFQETEAIVKSFLIEERKMDEHQADEFINMLRDIMMVNGTLNVTDVAFLKYIPPVPKDDLISEKNKKKYKAGQTKIANFLYSMTADDFILSDQDSKNIFTQLLKDSLSSNPSGLGKKKTTEEEYYVLPFIKRTFNEDLAWLLKQDSSAIVRYIHLLLHFYSCYAILQALPKLSYKQDDVSRPTKYYFILKSEKASVTHDAVMTWKQILPKHYLDRIFGHSQALDILNCVLGGNVGFYSDIKNEIEKTPFEENKDDCEELLRLYQEEKRYVFSQRSSESASIDEIETDVNSYEEFFQKFEKLCCGLQSPSYISRMRKKVIDLLCMRFLQLRRGNYVLVLDNEMLVFLIAMLTKNKRTKLDDLYKRFVDYGIVFNRGSRIAIEAYLMKLNLLDRKSDSGEAQYVKVIL